jgi:hypothetical protein
MSIETEQITRQLFDFPAVHGAPLEMKKGIC